MQCNYKETSRVGLYIMVFLILMHSCGNSAKLSRIEHKLNHYVLEEVEKPLP